MKYLIISFLVSIGVNYLFILIKSRHLFDIDSGVQKFHTHPTPRIGGVGVYLGFITSFGMFIAASKPFYMDTFKVIIVTLPVFISGVLEDITKKVTPRVRLIFAFISGVLAVFFVDAGLNRLDLLFMDYLLKNFWLFSLLFTAIALAGIANAMNIIDGFNGLAGGVSIIIFLSYAYVSFIVNDPFLLYLSLVMAASILGFFILNFPFGKIFLGDGGSYFIGFISGLVGILLVKRHPNVSAWFVLMLLAYPVFETFFSVYRRKILIGKSPFEPDDMHLHTLVYKKIIKKRYKHTHPVIKNSLTSPYLWGLQIMALSFALLFWKSTPILVVCFIVFCLIYVIFYFRLVRILKSK